MTILVAYASKHGATQGIAERIAEHLSAAGSPAVALPAREAGDLGSYEAFIVGSAVYNFHWMKDAVRFLQRHRETLAGRPVWLFSSGPLGTETTDAQGRDVLSVSVASPELAPPMFKRAATEMAELQRAIGARDHRVFFGAYHPGKPKGMSERLVMMLPAARAAMPEGDFRDWPEIDGWAASIARELA
jgi:menaquinone-dependent protoporphyrinogen oxidase